jgi:hypothetical protein
MRDISLKLRFFFRAKWTFQLVIVILIIIVYSPVVRLDFAYSSDDHWMLLNNSNVWSSNITGDLFLKIHYGQYSPLNTLYYRLVYKIFGLNPFPFYFLNISLHYINTILLYQFSIEIFRIIPYRHCKIIAQVSAIFFAIHPINIESVAWISCSKILLSSLCTFLSLILYLKYLRTSRVIYVFFTFLCAIVAFGFKEQAMVVLLMYLVLYFMIDKKYKDLISPFHLTPFFLLSILEFYWSAIALKQISLDWVVEPTSVFSYEKMGLVPYTFTHYLINLAVPIFLEIKYTSSSVTFGFVNQYWLFFTFFYLSVCVKLFSRVNDEYSKLMLLLFFSSVCCFLNIVTIPRFSLIADRYMYLSSFIFSNLLIHYLANHFDRCRLIMISITYGLFLLTLSIHRAKSWDEIFF